MLLIIAGFDAGWSTLTFHESEMKCCSGMTLARNDSVLAPMSPDSEQVFMRSLLSISAVIALYLCGGNPCDSCWWKTKKRYRALWLADWRKSGSLSTWQR